LRNGADCSLDTWLEFFTLFIMNTESTAVLRVPAEIHRRLKSLAAREGRPLADLAAEAVQRELSRREEAELVRLAVAPPWPPAQTR